MRSEKPQAQKTIDILKIDFDWKGKDVYIVGSGPNAAPYMVTNSADVPVKCLPIHSKIIACSKGVFSRTCPTVWLCATPALAQCDWFNTWMRKYAANAGDCKPPFIVGRWGEWLKNYAAFTHYFQPGASLWSHVKRDPVTNKLKDTYKGFGCADGYLRGGAGAVARGVQLAWFNEAARCILVGADMTGMKYFDGTINKWKHSSLDKEGNWIELTYFNELIKWVKARGMDVVSLTETALDVEVIKGKQGFF